MIYIAPLIFTLGPRWKWLTLPNFNACITCIITVRPFRLGFREANLHVIGWSGLSCGASDCFDHAHANHHRPVYGKTTPSAFMSLYTFVPNWCKIKVWRFFLYNMFQVFINHIVRVCVLVGADISASEQIAQATLDTNRQMDDVSTTHLAAVRGLVIRWFVRVCSCIFVLSQRRVVDEFRPTTFTQ
jgi:hypothetical protein